MTSDDFKRLDLDARRALLLIKVKELAALLTGWRFDGLSPSESCFFIIGDHGARVGFALCSPDAHMIRLIFTYPDYDHARCDCRGWGVLAEAEDAPNFRFGFGRKNQAIADKLQKTVLSHYADVFQRCLVKQRARKQDREEVQVILAMFRRISPVRANEGGCVRRPKIAFYKLPKALTYDVSVASTKRCDLALTGVSPALAMQILALCADGG